jgi:uncharacterized membrane protein
VAAKTEHHVLTPSWKLVSVSIGLVKEYFTPLLYLVLLPSLVISLGFVLVGNHLTGFDVSGMDTRTTVGITVAIAGALITLLNLAAVYLLQLRATAHAKINLLDLYKQSFRYLPRLIGLGLVVGLLVVGGLILLIVPGLIMFRRYLLAGYYLVDQDLSIGEAMRRSAASSKPAAGYIWGVIGVQALFSMGSSIFGILPSGLGEFAADVVVLLVWFLPVLRYIELRDGFQSPAQTLLQDAPRDND